MKFPNIDPSYCTSVVVACYERKLVRGYVAESTFAGKRLRECVGYVHPKHASYARVNTTRKVNIGILWFTDTDIFSFEDAR